MKQYKLFIVEDDLTIARILRDHLMGWGFDVCLAEDFRSVSEKVYKLKPDLILLDIALPFYNGFHWCAEIRKFSKVPVIFISSANDNMNVVMAINMGGDDFVAKPFDLNVLTAKIQALLRRAYDFSERSDLLKRRGAILNLGDAALEVDGKRVELTRNEVRILQALMEQAGRVVARGILMERLWESDSFVDENTLTVNINRLRKKLEEAGLSDFIVTRKGIGYEVE